MAGCSACHHEQIALSDKVYRSIVRVSYAPINVSSYHISAVMATVYSTTPEKVSPDRFAN